MIEILKAILFGIVEGVTEWLPISSTGHLILLDEFVALNVSAEFKSMFDVVIQLGAILAVVVLFFHKLNPFAGDKTPQEKKSTWSLWAKVVVSIIPSGALHYIAPVSGAACRYYCLIVDPSLLEGTSLPGGKTSLQRQVNDPQVQALYLQLAQELEAREPYYRDAAKSLIRLLFTRLYRCWSTGEERQPAATGHQPEMVKQAILYLQAHYKE